MYSISSRSSFQEAAQIRENLMRLKDGGFVPIVLCGNKCDLKDQRVVSRDEGAALASSWGKNKKVHVRQQ